MGRIIRRNAHADTVTHNHADIETSHFSAKLGVDKNFVIKFNFVDPSGESIYDFSIYLC